MARISNITFGQVAAIADAMKAAGTRPTARAVRERIGSGSMGTIHKLLQQWTGKASEADEDSEAAELPMHIQNALMDFIGTEIATACEPINEELQAAKEAAEDIAQDNERMHQENTELRNALDECSQERAAAMAMLNTTRDELRAANKARESIGEANTALLRDLDRSQRQTEMLASMQPDLEAARSNLTACVRERNDAERSAAVLSAQLDAKTERADELEARLKTAEALAAAKDAELKQANNHYQAYAARLEAAAREIESLRKKPAPTKATAPKKTAAKNTNEKI